MQQNESANIIEYGKMLVTPLAKNSLKPKGSIGLLTIKKATREFGPRCKAVM